MKKNSKVIKNIRRKHPLDMKLFHIIGGFVRSLECIREMDNSVMPQLKIVEQNRKKIIDNYLPQITGSKKKKRVIVKYSEIKELLNELNKLGQAEKIFRENLLITFVSKFDYFISEILRITYKKRPELLDKKESSLSYSELSKFSTIKDAVNQLTGDEIDKFLHQPHYDQLSTIDGLLKLGILDDFKGINNFIEITERRNLFVHNDGRLNSIYEDNCKKVGIILDDKIKIGKKLDVNDEYFEKAYKCLFELAVRIGQGASRRLFKEKLRDADDALNEIGFGLLFDKEWDLADKIYKFALSIPKKFISDDKYYKMFLINRCIALDNLNKKKEMNSLIDGIDWSACESKYKMGIAVLKRQYDEAESLMTRISVEDLDEVMYNEWPLFNRFRQTIQFKRAYKKKFRKEFGSSFTDKEKTQIKKL